MQDAEPELSPEAEAVKGRTAAQLIALHKVLTALLPRLRQCQPGKVFKRNNGLALGMDGRLHPVFPTDLTEQAEEHDKAHKGAKVASK